MRTLCLLRHAKSSWDDDTLVDFDRPLAPRGQAAAPKMGRYLRRRKLAPDLVLCSSANRAQATWNLVARELRAEPDVTVLKSLYLAPPSRVVTRLKRLPATIDTVLIIGHNPGLENLLQRLCGSGKRKALERLQTGFPSAALAQITFDIDDWADMADGSGRLRRFVRPRDLD